MLQLEAKSVKKRRMLMGCGLNDNHSSIDITNTSQGLLPPPFPPPLTNFNDGGWVRRIFWGLKFWPKGILIKSMKDVGIFWVAFQKISKKFCRCKSSEEFSWVC